MSDDQGNTFSADQREVLDAFSKALQRETHTLQDHPDLLWQQLHNRLQWEGGPESDIVAAERVQNRKSERKPWIRTRTPFPESIALIRNLTGHTGRVYACAFSQDGGATWDHDWIIRDDGPDGDLGYPSTVELADGGLFTVYYQKARAGEKCSLLWSRWRLPEGGARNAGGGGSHGRNRA